MMKRKVNRVGQNTLTVSLPTKWVKKTGIKQGDDVDVEEEGPALSISTDLIKKGKEIDIKLTKESERYIRSRIGRLYMHGYSKINVSYDHPDVMVRVKHAVNDLIGADIIDTEMNRCIIQVLPVEGIELDFDKNLIKILMTLKYMFSIVKGELEQNRFNSEKTLSELRQNNWRIRDFILRNASIQHVNYETINSLSHVLFCYEKIGTKLLGFYKRYVKNANRIKNSKRLIPLFKKIDSFIEWLISTVSQKKPLTLEDENKFRHDLLKFNVYLLNELHKDRNIDHPFLTIIYFCVEMFDSTISNMENYKRKLI